MGSVKKLRVRRQIGGAASMAVARHSQHRIEVLIGVKGTIYKKTVTNLTRIQDWTYTRQNH